MATKESNPGLLSKMARFVRNPTRDWSDLDKPESESAPGSGYGKQVLKETIERKRRNDFVRRREFDYLRKLRRDGLLIGPYLADRPSFFQSSTTFSSDERAVTLKKIDEIEAQMSKQWWAGKPGEAVARGADKPEADGLVAWDGGAAKAEAHAGGSTFASTQLPGKRNFSKPGQTNDYASTQIDLSALPTAALRAEPQQSAPSSSSADSRSFDLGDSDFYAAELFSTELGDNLADPDLEEAAIRFANGDDAGAEAGLLAALQGGNSSPDSVDRWAAALFDLYRATGQQASFDCVALDYAQRFGRAAPGWFSTPDLLGHTALALPLVPAPGPGRQTSWDCPAELDWVAVQALQSNLLHIDLPWVLNWSELSSVTPEAAKPLAKLFADWCSEPVKLHFDGVDALNKTLRHFTPSGDRRVDSCWWRLRLDCLRILRLHDEFELVALDFCVTYEVAPPTWTEARCEYVPDYLTSAPVLEEGVGTASLGLDTPAQAVVELAGEVLGDATQALDKFEVELKAANQLVISCARLIRVDFSAAGSILNWAATRKSEGCLLEFRDVPRLVAAFFNVIGINEHARVTLRTS